MILPPDVSVEPRNGVQVVHIKGEIDTANGGADRAGGHSDQKSSHDHEA